MARPLRIEFAGALYHVMARGNQGRLIFADDQDRKRWLETLGKTCQKTGWRIHACVLMGHHYPLLVETPAPNLSAGMKWLQSAYTSRYNRRHRWSSYPWHVSRLAPVWLCRCSAGSGCWAAWA